MGSPAKRTLDAAQRPRRYRMAASPAFERLQPWSAYWLALRARTDSAPRLLLLLSPNFEARKSVALHPASCLHTWFSNIGCAAAHQSPIRIKAGTPCGAWPLAAFAAPENPLFPTVSNRGGRTSRPHKFLALPIGDPTPCGSRCGRNELFNLGGIGAGVQSSFMVLPTLA